MLANGRRTIPVLVPGQAQQPAWAGVVTGSFAQSRTRVGRRDHLARPRRLPHPARQRRAVADDRRLLRPARVDGPPGDRRRPRAVGQHVRVQRRVRDLDARRLPRPPAALPDPLDRLHPGRRRAGDPALRGEPRVGHQGARAGAPERAAADDPRRDGGHLVRHVRDELRGRRRLPRPGARRTGSAGCRATRSSTRSPTAP